MQHSTSTDSAPRLQLWLVALSFIATTSACGASTPHTPQTVAFAPSLDDLARLQQPTTFIGEGRLSHAPEYIELTVTVHAECYATPMAANKAADTAAAQVMTLLGGALDPQNPKDGVFSQGGYSRPFSRYDDGRTTCRGTFAKTSTIVMKTSRIADFAARYPQIQEEVLQKSLSQPADGSSSRPVTYATLDNPQPQLYYETREKLEQQALADALLNARQKFEATATMACGPRGYGILRMVEKQVDGGRPIAYGRSQPASGAGATLELDAIWINKLLEVAFTAEPGTCKPLKDQRP